MELQELLGTGTLLAIVMGLTELAKRLGTPSKFLPLFSVMVGLCLAALPVLLGSSGVEILLGGLVVGLTASGLFDQSKILTK